MSTTSWKCAASVSHAALPAEHPGTPEAALCAANAVGADSLLPLVPDYVDDDHDGPSATVAVELSRRTGRNVPWCFNRKEAKGHGEGVIVGARPRYGVAELDKTPKSVQPG